MAKLNNSAIAQSHGAGVRRPTPNKRITRGKGAMSPNPQSSLESSEARGGLKGPYHG